MLERFLEIKSAILKASIDINEEQMVANVEFEAVTRVIAGLKKCSVCQASPEHLYDFLGLSKQDLYEDPLMVLDFLRVNEIMDLL
ncbi:hypothetical protein TNCV_1561021 [Trichonephila clavipes]|nr:hypothetical protein TNCV_1561021 [Trichonephila clavipes]